MAERAIFLDRDNTIIHDDGYLGDPAKVKLLPGAGAALTSLRALGYRLIVVSNQSGVGRGLFKETDVQAVNDEMSRQLRQQAGAYVDASYYCPFHPEAPLPEYRADHDWRKPRPGMLLQAAGDFNLDLSQCWMIGDSWRDVAAGSAAGCRTIHLKDPDKKCTAEEERMEKTISPNFVVRSLTDAARIIVREGRHAPPPPPSPSQPAAREEVPGPPPAEIPPVPNATPSPAAPPSAVPLATTVAVDEEVLAKRIAATLAERLAAAMPPTAAPDAARKANGSPTAKLAPIAQVAEAAPSSNPTPGTPSGPPQTAAPIEPLKAGSSTIEKHLDELVVQLRQQNRNADLRPDFSLSHILALIIQAFALVTLVIGFFKYFTMRTALSTPQDIQLAALTQTQALIWVMIAVFLQGTVVALLIYARGK